METIYHYIGLIFFWVILIAGSLSILIFGLGFLAHKVSAHYDYFKLFAQFILDNKKYTDWKKRNKLR